MLDEEGGHRKGSHRELSNPGAPHKLLHKITADSKGILPQIAT